MNFDLKKYLAEGKLQNEQSDFEAGHSDRMKELINKLDYLVYDDYHADVYMNDNIKLAFENSKKVYTSNSRWFDRVEPLELTIIGPVYKNPGEKETVAYKKLSALLHRLNLIKVSQTLY